MVRSAFELERGQVWQQVEFLDFYLPEKLISPAIIYAAVRTLGGQRYLRETRNSEVVQ
jgi:hypothetical protein